MKFTFFQKSNKGNGMMKRYIVSLFALGSFLVGCPIQAKKGDMKWTFGDTILNFSGVLQTETGFNKNTTLLNNNVPYDMGFVVKTNFDMSFHVIDPCVETKVTLRNKATWGNNKSFSTNSIALNDNGFLGSQHSHGIGARAMWIREGWVKINFTDLFAMKLPKQEVKLGSFSFALGRGISLGDAYAVSPASLGFFQDFSVNQFAYGALVSGSIVPSLFGYDAYIAILENNSTSLADTCVPTQRAAFGGKNNPTRGFGVINWVLAGRINIDPLKTEYYKLHFEPYALYNSAPEQTLEYLGDSKSNLGTIGMAMEFSAPAVEFGFDFATNRGQQQVKGWDRNKIQKVNRGGIATYVYSDVYTVNPATTVVTNANKAVCDPSNTAQVIAISDVNRSAASNGTEIEGTGLYNSTTRFRPPYTNKFQGYMLVADGGLWLLPKRLMVSVGGGISSGDVNPNAHLADSVSGCVDSVYEGFVPLQEVYTGDRIRSTYVLGGSGGYLKRLMPDSGNGVALVADAFTNLIFVGFSARYLTTAWGKPFVLQPNILTYRADVTCNKFDITTGTLINKPADNHLGIEFNIFNIIDFTDSLKSTFVGIVFVPGQHYKDIKGKPFTPEQKGMIGQCLASGRSIPHNLPVVGSDIVFGASWLFTYAF